MDAQTLILSQWRITFGETVLLDFDDLIPREVRMPWQPTGAAVPRPNAKYLAQIAYGNAANMIEFSRMQEFASVAAARDWLPSHNALLPDGVADVLIEVFGGSARTLKGARLTAANPTTDGRYFSCEYQITGGEIILTGWDILLDGGGPGSAFAIVDGGGPGSALDGASRDGGAP